MESVLRPAYDKYLDFSRSLADGSLIFEKCEEFMCISASNLKMTKSQVNDWKDNFLVLMKSSNFDEKLIRQRMKQIDLYLNLCHLRGIGVALNNVKEKNELEQSFEILDTIKSSVG